MRLWLNRAHLGLVAVALIFLSSMGVLGGRAYHRAHDTVPKEKTFASRPAVDGHRVSLASARGR
jgi:hypothetical protein